jgi:competence protein ComEC
MTVTGADSTGTMPVKASGGAMGSAVSLLGQVRESLLGETRRTTIWSPVFLVIGIWSYFGLAYEPATPLLLAALAVAGLLLWPGRNVPALRLVSAMLLGFALTGLRTHYVASPLLRAYSPDVIITGHVADANAINKARTMLVIDVDEAIGVPAAERPQRIKMEARADALQAQVGDTIHLTGSLVPLPRPVLPGGFDYARSLYFQSIGATGWTNSPVQLTAEDVPAKYWLTRLFHGLRKAIGGHVRAAIVGPIGSIADALITGERTAIPRSMVESLQKSGLFHILSISGLHMAMVAGGTFWLIRAVLALFPVLVLNRPIKKWAAAAAVAIGLIYDLMADSGPATDRSFIMIAVMFFAVTVDRPAISLHNLAIAALIILLLQPEQAVSASFQMSFMAVMGLAGFFEWWNHATKLQAGPPPRAWLSLLQKAWRVGTASVLTSLIAGGLSGIPAAHHFGRLAPFGVVANALALPVVSVVMPAALAATLLMPFGLEAAPLWIMDKGLRLVMMISDWVASWPLSSLSLPPMAAAPTIALSIAAVLAFMGRGAVRWFALLPLAAAIPLWQAELPAQILFEDRANTAAILTPLGDYAAAPIGKFGGALRKWRDAVGHRERPPAKAASPWTCANEVCAAQVADHSVIFLGKGAEAGRVCPPVDVVLSAYPLHHRCQGRLATIDRFDVWKHGAYGLRFTTSGVTIQTAVLNAGSRPWSYVPRARMKTSGYVNRISP